MGLRHSHIDNDRKRLCRRLHSVDAESLLSLWSKVCSSNKASFNSHRFKNYMAEKNVPTDWTILIMSMLERSIGNTSCNPSSNFMSFIAMFISDDPHCTADLFWSYSSEINLAKRAGKKCEQKEISKSILFKIVENILKLFLCVSKNNSQWQKWHLAQDYSFKALVDYVVKDLDNHSVLSHKQLLHWLSENTFLRNLTTKIFQLIFLSNSEESLLPTIYGTARFGPNASSVILDSTALAFLALHLPVDLRKEYRLVYSNRVHNSTFTKVISSICNSGPILLIIQDTNGYVYGGFTRVAWSPKSSFYGSKDSFLFTIHPKMNVYRSSGTNSNFMFLDTNEESTYNGLGMGGQLGDFGLFINGDCTFEYGCSNPCKTYNSPCLSSSRHFRFVTLEAWLLNGDCYSSSTTCVEESRRCSILDSDPTVLTLLSLAGRGSSSENFRDPACYSKKNDELSMPMAKYRRYH